MSPQNDYFNKPEEIVAGLEKLLENKGSLGLAFDDCREGNQQVIQVDEKYAPDPEQDAVWFFGDIHGDLLGMIAAIKYAEEKSRKEGRNPLYIFLGDFTDRGPYDYLVLLKLYSLILDDKLRKRICMVVGNHDECLEYNEESGKFYATVDPAEFTDWLNDSQDNTLWQRLGKATIEFFKRMPRAIFLPDGLLIAHAGVPHTDLHDRIKTFDDLNLPLCLQDFVWSRAHERAPKRRPNRDSKGHSFGRKDFEAFCKKATEVLKQPVKRMLRGHDHYIDGHRYYTKYQQKQILTLNTRCIQPDMMDGPYSECLCVARWEKEKLPTVHILEACRDELKKVNRPASESEDPDETDHAEGTDPDSQQDE